MRTLLRVSCLPLILAFFAACASPPPVPAALPPPPPDVPLSLSVENVRAVQRDLGSISFAFSVAAKNEDSRQTSLESIKWELFVDDAKISEGQTSAAAPIASGATSVLQGESAAPVSAASGSIAKYRIAAAAVRSAASGAQLRTTAEAKGDMPVIREPRFSVKSIKIKKAELINTKFEVVLRVENPNAIPLTLTSLDYELFGERRLWTDGDTAEPICVDASGATEKKLKLAMNFINMKRDLLDQVIRLEIVDYRFRGKARISTGLKDFPLFVMPYDLEGRTSVVE